ncbi:MAG: hypothetical protein A2537_02270 [Candidatus Magasanikbacteria bacterium RIFOXYD2_FULL_36_9]|uniref:Uncharacterized protein n=1 Tax=Candidatus Magasanikbacteria bacterium RIFOXYD2_FULL_36_9 TaxID=1798707 RepID=A0A1F6P1K4_9BACT|nr:MAG: hypothetical protein A2537_02270 [Candidatus Magasanikbacteria bacterium RIFOXYD2_FULL_36_9]
MSEIPKPQHIERTPQESTRFELDEIGGRKCLVIFDAMGDEGPCFSKYEARARAALNPFISDETRIEIERQIDNISDSDLPERVSY